MKILLIQPGLPEPVLRDAHGEYADWFFGVEGIDWGDAHVTRPYTGERLPDLTQFQALIITGSNGSVYEGHDWIDSCGRSLAAAVRAGQPVLGVCYGHQLLGHSLGGEVVANPAGREIGTVEVSVTAAGAEDELLGPLPARFPANAAHGDVVVNLPPDFPVLAANASTAIQAARFGSSAWGVQFHPELKAPTLRTIITTDRERLAAEGLDSDTLLAGLRPCTASESILRRFIRHAESVAAT